MNIVLLSGGSGKRLWPLSNDTLSKQFLKLLKNQQGVYESMVQRVMRQLGMAHPNANIFVSCNWAQKDVLQSQLGGVEMILEPSRRDTFPAIALAAAYLRYNKKLDENDTFILCPIDVFADGKYFELFAEVEQLVNSGKKNLGLLGVTPTYPSEKYGYIIQNNSEVTGFVEKPSATEAEQLIGGGALWNCGVFALKIGYALGYARKYAEFNSFQTLHEQYSKLPRISFDYEVVEKEPSIGSAVYNGVWKDLGTWNTLTEEMNENSMGNNILISENSQNTHVLNMLNIPIIVQELTDAVIIASHDGILASSKHGSSFLKPLAEQINIPPMYEQRNWGNYRVLEHKQNNENSSLVKRVRIDSGQCISYRYCDNRSEVLMVVSGEGILAADGVESRILPGRVIQIQGGNYSVAAVTELELIEVQVNIIGE